VLVVSCIIFLEEIYTYKLPTWIKKNTRTIIFEANSDQTIFDRTRLCMVYENQIKLKFSW